jgi:hypothetical protein
MPFSNIWVRLTSLRVYVYAPIARRYPMLTYLGTDAAHERLSPTTLACHRLRHALSDYRENSRVGVHEGAFPALRQTDPCVDEVMRQPHRRATLGSWRVNRGSLKWRVGQVGQVECLSLIEVLRASLYHAEVDLNWRGMRECCQEPDGWNPRSDLHDDGLKEIDS